MRKQKTCPSWSGNCNPCQLNSPYSGGALVGLGDGTVRMINTSITPQTWGSAVQPADGNTLGSNW